MEMSRRDPVWWINYFGWTYDPRLTTPFVPMILYPKQVEYIDWLTWIRTEKFHGVAEKSRDAGVTWLTGFRFVHWWLFEDGFSGGFGSRKEDLVDKGGDMNCIFEKLVLIVERLPKWMQPKGWDVNKYRKHLLISNPENGSTLNGEAGVNIGRGGRSSIYNVDESAFTEQPQKIASALSQNTEIILDTSTPNGNGNQFAQKRRSAFEHRNEPEYSIKLFTMHWLDDPRKNSHEVVHSEAGPRVVYPWYERQKEVIRDPVIIAQELDIDYSASIEGICIPAKYVAASINFDTWLKKERGIDLPMGSENVGGYDVADGGTAENVLIKRSGPKVVSVRAWNQADTFTNSKRVADFSHAMNIDELHWDNDGVGAAIGYNFKSGKLGTIRFVYKGVRSGGRPSNKRWVEGIDPLTNKIKTKSAKDKFKNRRAEIWWEMRLRMERTFEYRELGVQHDLGDLISIPDNLKLIDQLSSVLTEDTDDGKIRLESKKHMREIRGVPSPDYADALVFSFAELPDRPQQESTTASQETWA